MDSYGLVLNAGSSSLKFCVFARPEGARWQLTARGAIDGIGTSPRLTARDEAGEKLADETLDAGVSDPRAAIGVLARWLQAKGRRAIHRASDGGPAPTGVHRVRRGDPPR